MWVNRASETLVLNLFMFLESNVLWFLFLCVTNATLLMHF